MSTTQLELVEPVAERPRSHSVSARCHIDQILRHHDPSGVRWNYWRLIHALQAQSDLLKPSRNTNRGKQAKRIALACARLSRCNRDWSRAPESWYLESSSSESISDYQQWASFVSHVLHQYSTPTLFARTWLQPDQIKWHRDLHRHLSRGQSIRNFPIPEFGRLGKQHAKWFMQAPEDASVDEALRWSQVRAAGGDSSLARIVMKHVAINDTTRGWNETWANVIDFLVRNQPINSDETIEILQFVQSQRFQPARQALGAWMGNQPVRQEIDVRRWSLRRMRRWMVNWREEYVRPPVIPKHSQAGMTWDASVLDPLEVRSGDDVWKIVELCTQDELRVEGGILQHCVGGYFAYCSRGVSSIWSLRKFTGEQMKRVATIEVDPRDNRLVQAKGKRNARPASDAMALIRKWAKREGIRMR